MMRGLRHAALALVLALVLAGPAWAAPGLADAAPTPAPEPASVALVGAGMVGLGVWRRRRMAVRSPAHPWTGRNGAG